MNTSIQYGGFIWSVSYHEGKICSVSLLNKDNKLIKEVANEFIIGQLSKRLPKEELSPPEMPAPFYPDNPDRINSYNMTTNFGVEFKEIENIKDSNVVILYEDGSASMFKSTGVINTRITDMWAEFAQAKYILLLKDAFNSGQDCVLACAKEQILSDLYSRKFESGWAYYDSQVWWMTRDMAAALEHYRSNCKQPKTEKIKINKVVLSKVSDPDQANFVVINPDGGYNLYSYPSKELKNIKGAWKTFPWAEYIVTKGINVGGHGINSIRPLSISRKKQMAYSDRNLFGEGWKFNPPNSSTYGWWDFVGIDLMAVVVNYSNRLYKENPTPKPELKSPEKVNSCQCIIIYDDGSIYYEALPGTLDEGGMFSFDKLNSLKDELEGIRYILLDQPMWKEARGPTFKRYVFSRAEDLADYPLGEHGFAEDGWEDTNAGGWKAMGYDSASMHDILVCYHNHVVEELKG